MAKQPLPLNPPPLENLPLLLPSEPSITSSPLDQPPVELLVPIPWNCRELTTLWVARLDEGTELKVTDPKEQQGDVEEKETEGEERRDGVDGRRRRAGCC